MKPVLKAEDLVPVNSEPRQLVNKTGSVVRKEGGVKRMTCIDPFDL